MDAVADSSWGMGSASTVISSSTSSAGAGLSDLGIWDLSSSM